MKAQRDYYEVLGVGRDATAEGIKRAYRQLAAQHHPDRNPGDPRAEERFKELSEAYSVLIDPEKRRRYDRMGHSAFRGSDQLNDFENFDFHAVTEILEGLFGGMFNARKRPRAPRDLTYDLSVSFEEAALGTEKTIVVRRPAKEANQAPEEEELIIRVPPGVSDGAVRTVRGAGEIGPAGRGDLHVYIRIRPHPIFTREGSDVVCSVPVTFPQAVLGTKLDIPTLEGPVRMKLPAGTQSGRVFRLRGRGVPVFGGYGRGDQLVKILVEVPEKINERQRELIEALGHELTGDAQPRQQSFMAKLRGLFG